jgi:hypothetical protein
MRKSFKLATGYKPALETVFQLRNALYVREKMDVAS